MIDANLIAGFGIAGSVNHPIGSITAGGSIYILYDHNIQTTGPAATMADLAIGGRR